MRLRGRFKDPQTFLKVLQTLAKLGTRCILRFSPDEIVVVLPKGADSVEVFAVFDAIDQIFSEYRSESNFDNQINIEVITELLCDALKRMTPLSDVTMKLAKRDTQALLNFEVVTRQSDSREVAVLQSIPIAVRKPKNMAGYRTPEEAAKEREGFYEVLSSLPDLGEVRVVADRLRMMDPVNERITIASNRSGELKTSISSDEIKVATQWTGLRLVDNEQAADTDRNPAQQAAMKRFHSVDLDAKSFGKLLACTLPDYDAECWLASRRYATFVVHARSALLRNRHQFVAHLMITLPALASAHDQV